MEKKKMDLVVSFDTTGSMFPVLSQVRREVESFVNTMFSEFSDLRIGIIAHGDYCDADDPYTIIYRELSRDAVGLCKFVRDVDKTYGGDADECYELVLNLAHSDKMGWREDADKIFVMIGDASPHSPSYPDNKDSLDWIEETDELRKLGIKIFSVHALASLRGSSRAFYKRIAEDTMGIYLTLDQFSDIVDLIKATVYQQSGEERLNEFITIIKDSGKLTRSMDRNIRRLKGEEVPDEVPEYSYGRRSSSSRTHRTRTTDCEVSLKEMGELVPVAPGRFQVMTVDENCDIKGFVTKNGIEFKKGRGFYELTKAETVQQYKEVIMQDRETGEMFNGSQVREKLKLSPQSEKGGVNEKLHAADAKEFRIFVQSTSVNRKLIAGTTFLYEIPDMEDTGTVIEGTDKKSEKAEKTEKKADVAEEKKPAVETTPDVEAEPEEKKPEAPVVEEKPKKKSTRKKKADKPVETEAGVETEEVSSKSSKSSEEAPKIDPDTTTEETGTPEETEEKVYEESVAFSDLGDTATVVSATNKEVDEMLMGKENKLTEKLMDHAKTLDESEEDKPVEREEEPTDTHEVEEEPTETSGEPETPEESVATETTETPETPEESKTRYARTIGATENVKIAPGVTDGMTMTFKAPFLELSDAYYELFGLDKKDEPEEKPFLPFLPDPACLKLTLVALSHRGIDLNNMDTRKRIAKVVRDLSQSLAEYTELILVGHVADMEDNSDEEMDDVVSDVIHAFAQFNELLRSITYEVFKD